MTVTRMLTGTNPRPHLTLRRSEGVTRWAANHDIGTMGEWWSPEPAGVEGNNGGGEYNDTGGTSVISTEQSRWSNASARLRLDNTTNGNHIGVRLFRWREARLYREAYYEAWYYFPVGFTMTQADPNWPYTILMQFKSRNEDESRNDPFWLLQLQPPPFVGHRLQLYWWGNEVPSGGPHSGETGGRGYNQTLKDIPIAKWFRIRWWLKQSTAGNYDGALKIWQDDTLIFEQTDIRTGYDNTLTAWGTDSEWACTLYSNGLTPLPASIYVDTARIWTDPSVIPLDVPDLDGRWAFDNPSHSGHLLTAGF